jgi:asparagine synthase (glutamine-hydrolysing)
MSGIAGIYNLDGHPVDAGALKRLTEAIRHRGPDGVGQWVRGSVGLGQCMFHTTPESRHERQPLLDETGDLCLTLDGRVDNRDELRSALVCRGANLRTDTDAEMVLRAYQCWGEQCPEKIIGDFAFAVWDGRERCLFCARDPIGIRPFYYHSDGHSFLFGSEIQQVLADRGVPRKPNEGMIGEYLANAITEKEETLYRGIMRLPPGHFLCVGPGRTRKEQYWKVDPTREIRYRTDEEYAEHFRELFREAVRCRLRSHGPVGAYLSGGLDSSSVVVTARALYREGLVCGPDLETFSELYPGLPCDERPYIEEVTAVAGCKSNGACWLGPEVSRHAECVRSDGDFPDYPNDLHSVRARAREKGFRVLLTGMGGNHWLEGHCVHLADHLRRGRIGRFVRQACFDSRVLGDTCSPVSLMLHFGLKPLLPKVVRRVIKSALGRGGDLPPWIDGHFARRNHLSDRLRREDELARGFPSYAQRIMYLESTNGRQAHTYEMMERGAARFELEERHPFHDRRIIEFALALPEEQRWREDKMKFVLRRAMQNHLPVNVRERVIQADFGALFLKTFERLDGEGLLDFSTATSTGWVNARRVREMREQTLRPQPARDPHPTRHIWPLWMIFGVGLWFRAVFLESGSGITGGVRQIGLPSIP